MRKLTCDVVIVGSGLAGLACALTLPSSLDVIVITKKQLQDSNSYLAQGGISIRKGIEDREAFIEDTLKAGHYKNNLDAVELLVDNSEKAFDFLKKLGVPFTTVDGALALTREGAHSCHRIAYCDDETGKVIMDVLIENMLKRDNIRVLSTCELKDLLVSEGVCYGIYATDETKEIQIKARNTVLATGGIGGLYESSTNFSHITGDAIALATKHGIALKDMSYVQIHPTTLYNPKEERAFLISESVRGEGATLVNHQGNRFIDELAPRDIVTKAIYKEMATEKVAFEYLDMSTVTADSDSRFPTITNYLKALAIDPKKDKIPTIPSQHYLMGGLAVSLDTQTSMPHLYAVGEVACTGVHGQNRLASNSLLESIVFGTRASEAITSNADTTFRLANDISFDKKIIHENTKDIVLREIVKDREQKLRILDS